MLKDNLALLRTLYGFTQEEIAEKIGISRQAYAKWEKGTTIPDIERCAKLAQIYDTTIDNLFHHDAAQNEVFTPPAPKGKYIFGTVSMNDRGQIVIPKAARDKFDLKGGSRLIVLGEDGEGIALIKAEVFEKKMHVIMERANKEI